MTDRNVFFEQRGRPTHPAWQQSQQDLEQRIDQGFRRIQSQFEEHTRSTSSISQTASAGGRARQHTNLHTPLILWQFDGNALDTSGNGFDQAWTSGTARYTELAPGLVGAFFDGSSGMTRAYNATIAAALIAGSWTVEVLGRIGWNSALQSIFTHGVTGETEATNVLASWSLLAGGGSEALHEHGAGVNQSHTVAQAYNNGALFHGALRKSSQSYQFFHNGRVAGSASSALTAPSGGTSGTLNVGIGISANQLIGGSLASFKLVPRALTNAEILAEYNYTLGPVYGELS